MLLTQLELDQTALATNAGKASILSDIKAMKQ